MKTLGITKTLIFLSALAASSVTFACTGFQLKAQDGSFINGRTVEFASPIPLSGLIIPRNYAFTGTTPEGVDGLSYHSKYAAVGSSAFGTPSIVDGFNEKGLSAAMFYFPGYAEYTPLTPANKKKSLSPTEFTNWVLTQFATVDEVKNNIQSVVIVPTSLSNWGGVPPFHYIVYDKSGKSIVIEPVKGKLVVTDNPIGVITNSPTIDWHLTNLSNYINLSPLSPPNKKIDGMQLSQFGQGAGLHGLPGDFSPPSRFVRAAIYSAAAVPTTDANAAVLQALHILNQFDLPPGSVRSMTNGKTEDDTTIATTVKDTKDFKYYIRTYTNQSIRMISLLSFDLNSKTLKTISYEGGQPITNISAKAEIFSNPTAPAPIISSK